MKKKKVKKAEKKLREDANQTAFRVVKQSTK
jgi:hypothetical protein